MCLDEKGITAYKVAKETGISTATLSSWKKGRYTPKKEKLQKIADYFGVRLEYLTGASPYRTDKELLANTTTKTVAASRIPVLGTVPCGIPVEAVQEILDWEEVKEAENYDGKLFALRAKGDSMAPRISEGDILVVHQQPDAESNELIIALVNGDEATCKELKKREDGIVLVPWNTIGHEPQFYSWKEIEQLPVRIIGKVLEIRSKPFRG